MKKTIALTLAALALLSVVACGKAKDSGSVRGRGARAGGGITPNGPMQGQTGVVYDQVSEAQFTQTVKSFVSSFVSAADVGRVNPNGGVQIKVGYNCNTWAAKEVRISINDEYVQQGAEPIAMTIQASGGSVAQNSTMTFSDEYGQVTLQGQITSGGMTGTFTWRNSQHADGGTPTSGRLGQLQIPAAAFYCFY